MKLSELVEPVSGPGRVFAVAVQTLIVLSLAAFSIDTLPDISPRLRSVLDTFELVSVGLFTVEYCLRLAAARPLRKYAFSFFGMIDLLAIAPFYISAGIDLRSIRVFRLFRLIRVFKLVRYSRAARRFADAFRLIRAELGLFLVACLFILFVASVGIYHFESEAQPTTFGSVFQCMWWALSTLTTVGYGDVYPVTLGGRIFTAFVLLVGLGIVAVPAGLIAGALSGTLAQEQVAADSAAAEAAATETVAVNQAVDVEPPLDPSLKQGDTGIPGRPEDAGAND